MPAHAQPHIQFNLLMNNAFLVSQGLNSVRFPELPPKIVRKAVRGLAAAPARRRLPRRPPNTTKPRRVSFTPEKQSTAAQRAAVDWISFDSLGRLSAEPIPMSRLFGFPNDGYPCWETSSRPIAQPRLSSAKRSLPLSSMTMKAGKSTTSIFQTASMPSSGNSTSSTFLMQSRARRAAGPPIEPR